MTTKLILINTLLLLIHTFTFIYPDVSPDILTINRKATYNIQVQRNIDISLNPTNATTQAVPNNSNIVVIFPSQFNLTVTRPVCTSIVIDGISVTNFTGSLVGNNFTISNAIRSAQFIENMTIKIENVTNPWPALTTDSFIVVIGTDISANSSSSSVTLVGDIFSSCSISYNPGFVNTTAPMILNITPTNHIPNNGYLVIQFPTKLQWAQDIATNRLIPIETATCNPLSGEITSGLCSA